MSRTKWKHAAFKKAAANVTTAYAGGWASGWIDLGEATHATLQLDYSDTDATSLQLKLETEEEGGTSGYEIWRVPGGVGAVDELTFTVSTLPGGAASTSAIALEVEAFAFPRFRVKAKQIGGAATGNTLALEVLAGGA